MSNPEFHTCCDCGYKWRHGQHGGHSCTEHLKEALGIYKAVADRAFNWNRVQGPMEVRELHNAVEIMKAWEDENYEKAAVHNCNTCDSAGPCGL